MPLVNFDVCVTQKDARFYCHLFGLIDEYLRHTENSCMPLTFVVSCKISKVQAQSLQSVISAVGTKIVGIVVGDEEDVHKETSV